MSAIHQFVPSLARHDAIAGHVFQAQDVLRGLGYRSDIYVEATNFPPRPDVRPYQYFDPPTSEGPTWLLYHASIGSSMARFVAARPEAKIVNYHNLTPPAFFEPWDPVLTSALEMGRRQLRDLAPVTQLAIADSEFNECDLAEWGYENTAVAPILIEPTQMTRQPDPVLRDRLQGEKAAGGTEWLFVGRLCPNKAQHDLIKALAAYRLAYDPDARLRLVGANSSDRYQESLVAFAAEIGCRDAVEFTGSVSAPELAAHYANADVFVCLSRHEGFCVPLLEAMFHQVPIVALRAAAVPETLGDAGILLPAATPALVAAAVHRVQVDDGLRRSLIDAGDVRRRDFALDRSRARFASVIQEWCAA